MLQAGILVDAGDGGQAQLLIVVVEDGDIRHADDLAGQILDAAGGGAGADQALEAVVQILDQVDAILSGDLAVTLNHPAVVVLGVNLFKAVEQIGQRGPVHIDIRGAEVQAVDG